MWVGLGWTADVEGAWRAVMWCVVVVEIVGVVVEIVGVVGVVGHKAGPTRMRRIVECLAGL